MNKPWVFISLSAVIILCLSLAPIQNCAGAYLLAPSSFYWSWQKSARNHRRSKQQTSRPRKQDERNDPIGTYTSHKQPINEEAYETQDVTSLLKQNGVERFLKKQTPKATSYYSTSTFKTHGRQPPFFMDLLHIFDARDSKKRTNGDSDRTGYSGSKTITGKDDENSISTLQSTKLTGSRHKTKTERVAKPCRSCHRSQSRKSKTRLKFGPWRGKRSVNLDVSPQDRNPERNLNPDRSFSEQNLSIATKNDQKSPDKHNPLSRLNKEYSNAFQIWRPEYLDNRNETKAKFFPITNNPNTNNSLLRDNLTSEKIFENLHNHGRLFSETLVGHLNGLVNNSLNMSQIQVLKTEMTKVISHKHKENKLENFVSKENEASGTSHVPVQNVAKSVDYRPRINDEYDRKNKYLTQNKTRKEEGSGTNDKSGPREAEPINIKNSGHASGDFNSNKNKIFKVLHAMPAVQIAHLNRGRFHFLLFDKEKQNARRLNILYRQAKLWARRQTYLHLHDRESLPLD